MSLSRENALEIGVRAILMLLFRYYDKAEPFMRHIQPEEVWLYNYPVTASYFPSTVLWCLCLGLPTLSFTLFYIFDARSRREIRTAISGLTLAFAMNAFLTSYIKILVGRPRPDFVNRCFPDQIGTDFMKCKGRLDQVLDGRRSFPSGHSSFSFVVMTFLSLCFLRWVDMTSERLRGLKLTFCLGPVLLATTIAISRTCDYHHHYQDIIVGSLMGATIAYGVFKLYLKSEIPTNGRTRSVHKESETLTTDCK